MSQFVQGCDVEAILAALDSLEASRTQQKNDLFVNAYPGIVRAIVRNVPQKKILIELERLGLKLHPARFKEMMNLEAALRDRRGERICCETCGAVLSPTAVDEAPSTQENSSQTGQPGDNAQVNA